MAKTAAKKLDELMAAELNLKLSDHTAMIHHVVQLVDRLKGFVFVYQNGDQTFYDKVDLWAEANGMRLRIARFRSFPIVEERLAKRVYKRWYVWGGGLLIPMNITKIEDLKDRFMFLIDDSPLHQTLTVMPGVTDLIRSDTIYKTASAYLEWDTPIIHFSKNKIA